MKSKILRLLYSLYNIAGFQRNGEYAIHFFYILDHLPSQYKTIFLFSELIDFRISTEPSRFKRKEETVELMFRPVLTSYGTTT